jgi:hypothetical protein
MASTGKNQYATTSITDFYLNLAKLPTAEELTRNKTPQFITVAPKFQYRPDLLSYELYGNSSYWWLIALLNRNQLQDPIRDLKAGMVLTVLSPSDAKGII